MTPRLRLVSGPLADRMGRKVTLVPAMFLLSLVMLAFSALSSSLMLYVLAIFYAIGFGTIYPTLSAFLVDVVPAHARGSALGLYYTATGLASFSASTIGGLLWSAAGPGATFAFGAAAALAAAAVMLLGRGKVRRALTT